MDQHGFRVRLVDRMALWIVLVDPLITVPKRLGNSAPARSASSDCTLPSGSRGEERRGEERRGEE